MFSELFKKYDVDGNGYLNMAEVRKIAAQMYGYWGKTFWIGIQDQYKGVSYCANNYDHCNSFMLKCSNKYQK